MVGICLVAISMSVAKERPGDLSCRALQNGNWEVESVPPSLEVVLPLERRLF